MNPRLSLYQLAQTHGLPAAPTQQLLALADVPHEPAQAASLWWPSVRLLAAGLIGFGLVLWVAANWDALGRWGQFALLQSWVLGSGLVAWRMATLRVPMGLLCLLGMGALFAYFGQTYQTGADPWQLFALWAALALPLCLACKSDVLWLPWSLVACTGIGLWTTAYTGHMWRTEPNDLAIYASTWALLLAMAIGLGPLGRRWTGAGLWSYRAVVLIGITSITAVALGGLFSAQIELYYPLGLLLLVLAAVAVAQAGWFDIFALSVLAFCLDVLLVCGLARAMYNGFGQGIFGPLLLLGLAAAGILAVTVSGILRLQRMHTKG